MANIQIIGKRTSTSCKAISYKTGIQRYSGNKNVDAIINYGLCGNKLESLFKKFPAIKSIPIFNRHIGHSKYLSVKEAEKHGVVVPKTVLSLSDGAKLSDWIEKKVHSSQGIGIVEAKRRGRIIGKYYQEMIKDRKYELRVHAFSWIQKEEWAVHKRVGPPDQIAWNFHQGGHFQRVHSSNSHKVFTEAKVIAEKILKIMGMSFGAVDLIVDNSMKIYFIEINSSPGFSELSESIYFDAMSKLKSLTVAEAKRLAV